MTDLVSIVSIWKVQELNIIGNNDVLYDYLIKKLTNGSKNHSDIVLFVTYNHKISQIICNKSWNKITTIMNTQASELYIINCELQSEEIVSYINAAQNLLRVYVINGTVSETVLIKVVKSFIDKNVIVSISNVKVVDDDSMIRNFIISKEFYYDAKLSLMLSTRNWLCVYNVVKFQLYFIHQYFMERCPDYYGMTLNKKFEQLNEDKFDNSSVNLLFICGSLKDSLMNSSVEFTSYSDHEISAAASDAVGIHPSSKQISLVLHLQTSPTTWIQYSAVSVSAFYQIIDALSILHTTWTELDFTHCNIGDVECEIMEKSLRHNKCSSTVRKLNISLKKLSVSGMTDLVSIVSIWKVQELNIIGNNDVLYDCLIKKLTNGSKHHSDIVLFVTYNHKISQIICNKSWNKITTIMNTQASELYIINCELQSEKIFSYINAAQNLLRVYVINGTVSETILIKVVKSFIDKNVIVSISNVKIVDDDSMIRNFIISKEFYCDAKLSLMLSTRNWLCVYNVVKFQLHFIHQYFIDQCPDYYGMTLNKKFEHLNEDKFDNSSINLLFICGNLKNNLMNSSVEFTSYSDHEISAAASNVVGIHPSSKQISLVLHLQTSPTTWIQYSAVSVRVFYQIIDALSILHTTWTELDFTHCNIGDVECEIMEKSLRHNKCSSTIRKLNISLKKLSVSGMTDLVSIVSIWKVQELNISRTNDVLCECLIKNLTNGSKHQRDVVLFVTYNHEVSQIICNKSWNKITTIMNTQASELYIINCELQSEEIVSYLNVARNLLKVYVINGTVSEAVLIKVVKCFLDKTVELSISNVKVVDDDSMIRSFIISREFYHNAKLSLMLSTRNWLCVYNVAKYQLHFIHKYFQGQIQPDYCGITLFKKFKHIDEYRTYVFDNSSVNLLFICGNLKNSLMNSSVEFTSYSDHEISAAASDVVGIHPSSKQISLVLHLQTSPTTWIQYSAVSVSVFYQIIDALSILHTTWAELDFTHCNIGDVECEIMEKSLKCNNPYITVRKLNISLDKLSVSGITDLVSIVSIWKVKELNISGTNNVLFHCLIKNLTNGSKHQSDVVLFATYSHKILQIICNKSWNKITTTMNTQASELYIINCELQSEEIVSYLNAAQNLLRVCVINGTVSETVAIKILKSYLDKTVEVSISNVKIVDNDRLIRNLITNKEFYRDAKLNLVLSTEHWLVIFNVAKCQLHLIHQYFMSKTYIDNDNMIRYLLTSKEFYLDTRLNLILLTDHWLYAFNVTKYQLHLIHQYFITNSCSNYYGMTLARKFEQTNGIKMYIFEYDLLNLVHLHAKAFQASDTRTQIVTALSTTTKTTTEIENCINISEAADNLANIIGHSTQLQELHLNGNNFQINHGVQIVKELHNTLVLTKLSISTYYITNEVADDIAAVISSNILLQEVSMSENNFQAADTIIIIVKSLQKIVSLTKLNIDNNNISDEEANDIAVAISCNTNLKEFNIGRNCLNAVGVIKIARSLQKISMLKKFYINNNNITEKAANDIATIISNNTNLQEFDISSNELKADGAMKIAKKLQKISMLTKFCINNNKITKEAADDIAAAISNNANLQEFDIGSNKLDTVGAIKIVRSLQRISMLTKFFSNDNNITEEAADDIATAISNNTNLQEFDISSNKLHTVGAIKIARSLQKISMLTIFCINNNNITEEAADDVATAISNNTNLQEFDIGSNKLGTVGAIKIARSLQKILMLTKFCINDNNITEEAADDVATAISNNTNLQEFDIGSNKLGTVGAIKIARSLQKILMLTKFCINDNNITEEAADDIATAISNNTNLQEFHISSNKLHTVGTIKIARSLQKILMLTIFCINDNNITKEAADDIATVISNNTNLQEFHIGSNKLGTVGAIKIARSLQKILMLTIFCINDNNITKEAADDIATAISNNANLQEFDIGSNKLGTVGAIKIARSLQKISMLTKFCINNNNITEEAADDIATTISNNTNLQEFDIGSNKLGTVGAIKIARSLQKISMLTKLSISSNSITEKAADDIAAAISNNTNLQEIDIGCNKFGTVGAIKIARSLQKISMLTKFCSNDNNITDEAADDIATAIFNNTNLQEFDISSNKLHTVGAIKIAKSLQKISMLTIFCINDNNITKEAADDIATAISNNTNLQEFHIGSNQLGTVGAIKIARSLQKISMLTIFCINDNNITKEAADDIATAISSNTNLQEFDVGSNKLGTVGAIKIARNLQKISMLIKFCINNNNITEEAADDIATAISNNTNLQEFNIGSNKLKAVGAMKLAKSLQKISMLTKFCISNNNITEEAADDIAAATSNNTNLQEFDIGRNSLETVGVIKISRSLQKISKLTKLYIDNNNISDGAANEIAIAIAHNIHLQHFNIAKNNIQSFGAIKIAKSLQKVSRLIKLSFHDNYITDKAANDIATTITCNVHLQELDIGGNKFCAPGALTISRALQKLFTLQKLCFDYKDIAEEAATDIAVAICYNTDLKEISINGKEFPEMAVTRDVFRKINDFKLQN